MRLENPGTAFELKVKRCGSVISWGAWLLNGSCGSQWRNVDFLYAVAVVLPAIALSQHPGKKKNSPLFEEGGIHVRTESWIECVHCTGWRSGLADSGMQG